MNTYKYPTDEECPADMVQEPIPLGMFGFYTEDPEEFRQRVERMEADLDELDAGLAPPGKWLTAEEVRKQMYEEFPWLR